MKDESEESEELDVDDKMEEIDQDTIVDTRRVTPLPVALWSRVANRYSMDNVGLPSEPLEGEPIFNMCHIEYFNSRQTYERCSNIFLTIIYY